MRDLIFKLFAACAIAFSFSAAVTGCGDDSNGRTNDPYYDPYYNQRVYDPYYNNGYNNGYRNGNPATTVTFRGQIFVEDPKAWENYLRTSGLCSRMFTYYTPFTGPGDFGPDGCRYANQNPFVTISLHDYKFSNNNTSTGTLAISASHGGYAPHGLPATFRKIDATRFEATSAIQGLKFTFYGRPTDSGIEVRMRRGGTLLGGGILQRSR